MSIASPSKPSSSSAPARSVFNANTSDLAPYVNDTLFITSPSSEVALGPVITFPRPDEVNAAKYLRDLADAFEAPFFTLRISRGDLLAFSLISDARPTFTLLSDTAAATSPYPGTRGLDVEVAKAAVLQAMESDPNAGIAEGIVDPMFIRSRARKRVRDGKAPANPAAASAPDEKDPLAAVEAKLIESGEIGTEED